MLVTTIVKDLSKDSKDLTVQQPQRLDVFQADVKNENSTGSARAKQVGQ